MGQANIKRWIDELMPIVTDEADPLGLDQFASHPLPLDAPTKSSSEGRPSVQDPFAAVASERVPTLLSWKVTGRAKRLLKQLERVADAAPGICLLTMVVSDQ
jgi:hypothetical protein